MELERALNGLEDGVFGAIVQRMRNAPRDPTVPRPQTEPLAQGIGPTVKIAICHITSGPII